MDDDEDGAVTTVHYHFPIEVVVVGDIGDDVRSQLEEWIWQQLDEALR